MSSQPQKQSPQHSAAQTEAALQLGRPGPEHAYLHKAVGTWNVTVTHWMNDGEPPKKTSGTSTIESVFDGRYICENFFCADMNGKPFSGVATTGYDRVAQQYVTTWYDNMGTGITRLTGKASGSDRDVVYTGMMMCMPNAPMQVRHAVKWENNNRFVLSMFNDANGHERKAMEVVYERKS